MWYELFYTFGKVAGRVAESMALVPGEVRDKRKGLEAVDAAGTGTTF